MVYIDSHNLPNPPPVEEFHERFFQPGEKERFIHKYIEPIKSIFTLLLIILAFLLSVFCAFTMVYIFVYLIQSPVMKEIVLRVGGTAISLKMWYSLSRHIIKATHYSGEAHEK